MLSAFNTKTAIMGINRAHIRHGMLFPASYIVGKLVKLDGLLRETLVLGHTNCANRGDQLSGVQCSARRSPGPDPAYCSDSAQTDWIDFMTSTDRMLLELIAQRQRADLLAGVKARRCAQDPLHSRPYWLSFLVKYIF